MLKQLNDKFKEYLKSQRDNAWLKGYFAAMIDVQEIEASSGSITVPRKQYKWSAESRKRLSESLKAAHAKKREQKTLVS